MKTSMKRILAILLCVAMAFSLLPAMSFAAEEMPGDIWEEIAALEAKRIVPKRGEKISAADFAALSDEVAALVTASEDYVEGSCTYDGENAFFFWETTDGEVCAYSPRLRAQMREAVLAEVAPEGSIETVSYATKGGSASSTNVAVFQPYYGIDSSFSTQYKEEGKSIAAAVGGSSTTYLTTKATVDAIADAMESCGVVIFDSHGDTDYYKQVGTDSYGDPVYDCYTEANTSYICLQTNTGLTSADLAEVEGTYRSYYHAYYAGSYGSMKYYCVDGTAIANHMTSTAPNSLLWMAICLGMATKGLQEPLRAKGVEVVYGYSQSVTFDADYRYEEKFWDEMIAGKNVASAVATAKSKVGICDPYAEYYPAYPIVVSSEDTYPGQGNVDKAQSVKSAWTLYPQYTVTAVSNNTAYGTVSVSGTKITASPNSGYYVAGYTVTSGSATVTQEGNVFQVSASADCTIQINFAAKTSVTVSFSGAEGIAPMNGYAGDEMTLPVVSAPEGYKFLGWTEASLAEATTDKPAYFTTYTPTASCTLYALYSFAVGGTGATEYILKDISEISAADDVVITMEYDGTYYAMSNGNGSTAAPDAVNVTVADSKLVSEPAEDILWNIGRSEDAYVIYPKGSTDSWLYCTSSNNGVRVGTNSANAFSIDSTGNFLKHNGTSRYLGVYRPNPDWRCYTSINTNITGEVLGIYVKSESGTVYYTSGTEACEHNWVEAETVAPTCTKEGYTSYECSICGEPKEDNVLAPTGHNYGKWDSNNDGTHSQSCASCDDVINADCTYEEAVTPPTETEAGYTTYTCTDCGYSYNGNEKPALGAPVLVSFSVPTGVTAPDSQRAYVGQSIILAEPVGTPDAEDHDYSFIGWIAETVDNSTAVGSYYAVNSEYTVTEATTLYALYSYSVGEGGTAPSFEKLTAGESLSDGDNIVVVANGTDVAMYQETVASSYVYTYTFDGSLESVLSDAKNYWSVSSDGNGAYYLGDDTNGYLYNSADNKLQVSDSKTAWSLVDNGDGTFKLESNSTNRLLSYREDLATNPYWRMGGSTGTNGIVVLDIYRYTIGEGSTTYYTTLFAEAPCQHNSHYVNNGDGTHDYVCDFCGTVEIDNEPHYYLEDNDGACVCGEVLITEPTEDSNLTFGAQLYLENDLTMAFRVKGSKLANYDVSTAYLVVEREVYESGAKEAFVETMTITDYTVSSDGRYVFSYPGIAAAQMNDAIRATLYIKDANGKEYVSPVLETSVATYLDGLLSNSTSDTKLVTLIMDMVNYGAAAQVYFDRHADAPVNEAFESFKTYASYASADFTTVLEDLSGTTANEGATGKLNQGLDLGTRIGIQYKVTLPDGVSAEDATLVITDANGNELETIEVSTGTVDSKGRYIVNFYGSTSKDMRRVVYAAAYANGAAITGTYAYSISTYAWGIQENASAMDANLVNVTHAMMLYGDSASAYFG